MRKIALLLLTLFLLCCTVGCQKTPENPPEEKLPELDKGDELVTALTGYLVDLSKDYDIPSAILADKIEALQNGAQGLLVDFSGSISYYVCAYSASDHKEETTDYCCANDYIWIKYDDIADIKASYNDKKIVAAFSMNKATSVADIVYDDTQIPEFEHFEQFDPIFENGVLKNEPATFCEMFIYLNSSDESKIYHSRLSYNHSNITIPCMYIEGRYYAATLLGSVYPGEIEADKRFSISSAYFTEYDKYINDVHWFITPLHRVHMENGQTDFYDLLDIEDLSHFVKIEYEDAQLAATFEMIKDDASENPSLKFYIFEEIAHYHLKRAEEYKNKSWEDSVFNVAVICNFDKATEEEWYINSAEKDKKSLYKAFYDYYSSLFSGGKLFYYKYEEHVYMSKYSLDAFCNDYEAIISLFDLEYVEGITIWYVYGKPQSIYQI